MLQFATIAQFQTFSGVPVTTDDQMPESERARLNAGLVRASYKIAAALRLARIDYAPGGLPSHPVIAGDIAFATAAQFAATEVLGDATGFAQDFDSASLIGVAFSKRASGAALTLAQKTGLAPEAAGILAAIPGIWSTAVRRL